MAESITQKTIRWGSDLYKELERIANKQAKSFNQFIVNISEEKVKQYNTEHDETGNIIPGMVEERNALAYIQKQNMASLASTLGYLEKLASKNEKLTDDEYNNLKMIGTANKKIGEMCEHIERINRNGPHNESSGSQVLEVRNNSNRIVTTRAEWAADSPDEIAKLWRIRRNLRRDAPTDELVKTVLTELEQKRLYDIEERLKLVDWQTEQGQKLLKKLEKEG